MFSPGGLNAAPIEAAQYARARGAQVITVSSLQNATVAKPGHSGGKALPDLADVPIDNCVEPEDAQVDIGRREKVAAGSRLVEMGHELTTFVSPNVEGVTKDHNARARAASIRTLRYGRARGFRPLREAIAHYLARARGVVASAEQVLIVNGVQQALDLVGRLLIDRGDRVVVEEPCYRAARQILIGAAGAHEQPIVLPLVHDPSLDRARPDQHLIDEDERVGVQAPGWPIELDDLAPPVFDRLRGTHDHSFDERPNQVALRRNGLTIFDGPRIRGSRSGGHEHPFAEILSYLRRA